MDKASLQAIKKVATRIAMLLLVSLAYFAPQFTLGYLTSILEWNSYRIPIYCSSLAVLLYGKPAYLWIRRRRIRAASGNQFMYQGLPVADVAHFLTQNRCWKRDQAMRDLAISEPAWKRIGEDLEKHGVLIRGQDNARVLREIGLSMLVRQLRDDFPLIWDDISKTWVEKDDAYGRHLRERAFRQRKLEEQTERAERRLERTKEKMEEMQEQVKAQSPFATIMAIAPASAV